VTARATSNSCNGVEIGADAEIKWVSFLLGINDQVLRQKLTHKITETRDEKVLTPLNVDQALDARYLIFFFEKKII
jgi:myosin XV